MDSQKAGWLGFHLRQGAAVKHRVLVTGATGFVGTALVRRLADVGRFGVRAAVRREPHALPPGVESVVTGELSPDTDYLPALTGMDRVVHLAARVHVMRDTVADPLAEFRRVNVEGTMNLARQAVRAGVRRFIVLSSVKVHGESTPAGHPYAADDPPAPADPYAVSKHEAEQGLREVAASSGMEFVIIRAPLVYGPGVGANFLQMMRWVKRGVPLPFASVDNRRSLVALGNLVDLIVRCLEHPKAVNETFLASDGEDLSTRQLLSRVAKALGVRERLVSVPVGLLEGAARLFGRQDLSRRLCGSLQVDIEKTRTMLGWNPPISLDEALAETAREFLRLNASGQGAGR